MGGDPSFHDGTRDRERWGDQSEINKEGSTDHRIDCGGSGGRLKIERPVVVLKTTEGTQEKALRGTEREKGQ